MSIDQSIEAAVERAVSASLSKLLDLHQRKIAVTEMQAEQPTRRLWSEQEAAEQLGLSSETLRGWRQAGMIVATVARRPVRYSAEDVDAIVRFMANGNQ